MPDILIKPTGLYPVYISNYGAYPVEISSVTGSTDFITNGLITWYKFDEGSGVSLTDSSGNGNTSKMNGTWGTGKSNTAGKFNGTTNFISSSNTIDLSATPSASVCFWLNTPSCAGTQMLCELSENFNSYTDTFAIFFDSNVLNVDIRGFGSGDGYNAKTYLTASTNAWHHYAFVFDNTTTNQNKILAYLDGSTYNSASFPNSESVFNNNFGNHILYEMARNAGATLLCTGSMDGFRLYNRALSSSEVTSIYNLGGL
jgi:hypothetical protein